MAQLPPGADETLLLLFEKRSQAALLAESALSRRGGTAFIRYERVHKEELFPPPDLRHSVTYGTTKLEGGLLWELASLSDVRAWRPARRRAYTGCRPTWKLPTGRFRSPTRSSFEWASERTSFVLPPRRFSRASNPRPPGSPDVQRVRSRELRLQDTLFAFSADSIERSVVMPYGLPRPFSGVSAVVALGVVAGSAPVAAQAPPTVWPDEGPATWTPRPTTPEITADDLRTHVYQLAADSMRGRAAGTRGNYVATAYVASVFERLGLRPAGEEGTYFQVVPMDGPTQPEFPARNVIAILPGSDPALRNTYVLVGAHNDHEGVLEDAFDHDALRAYNRVMRPQGANDRPEAPTPEQQARIDSLTAYARSIRPPRADSVMNGADDDASGTGLLLEVAERFASGPAPARSILFISHASEEGGLRGSRYFTDNPTVPLDSIVAAHNMDMVGKGRVTDVRFGGPAQVQMLGARRLSAEFGDVIDSLNAVRAETMAIDYSWDRTNALNRFCRSDQVNYFRHTIPVTYFSTGYSVDYHMPTDEPQYLDYEHSARVGRFVHEIMNAVANRPTRLRILPTEERDLSAQCTR